jgi:adenylate cyclase class 1
VDLITPGISRDLQQQQLWISRHSDGTHGGHWRLYRNPPGSQPDAFPPIRASGSLVEMLAWLYINKLANSGSQIQLLPRHQHGVFPEHQRILQILEKRLGEPSTRPQPLEAFVDTPHALQSLAFLNVAAPPVEAEVDDTPSAVETVDHLLVTSWGEILVRTLDHGLSGVLDTLCNHLTMSCKDHGDKPAPLYSHCFSSGAADAVARRITALSVDIADCFRRLGARSRYVFRLEKTCYLVEQAEHEFHWLTIGDDERLLQFLQEPQARFRPVKLDPRILLGSPLVRVYEENIEGVVQVFYRLDIEGIDMFVLDDMGALFHQHYPSISEYNFLSQQQRLFDSLANRRLLTMANQAGQVLAGETLFYRLGQSPKGWIAERVDRPAKLPLDELDLVLVTSREGLADDDFMLVADNREFDALRLGRDLYREVARHVLERRHTGLDYPVRLTGVMPAGLEQGACWTVHEMLTTKRRIEQRLTRALRELQVLQVS